MYEKDIFIKKFSFLQILISKHDLIEQVKLKVCAAFITARIKFSLFAQKDVKMT